MSSDKPFTNRYQLEEMNRPLFLARMRQGEFDPPESNPYASLSKDDVSLKIEQLLGLYSNV